MTASTLPGKEEGFSPPCLLNIMTSIGLHIHLTSKRSLVGSGRILLVMQILSLLYLCSPHCFTTYVQVRLSHQWGIHVNYKMMFSISLHLIFPLSSKDKYKADNVLCCFFPPPPVSALELLSECQKIPKRFTFMSGALLSFESLQPQRTRPGDWKSPFSHESAGKGWWM